MFKNPSCVTLQETKLAKNATFLLEKYQVFQKNRNGWGGGLLTAVDPSLNPMLISSRNEDAETLTVQMQLHDRQLRVINGYGPQNDDTPQNKLNFWMGLEEEIIAAKSESCMILIQMDANAKVGQQILSSDPNCDMDGNGKLLLEVINRQHLLLLNVDRSCTGVITRERVTKTNTELAILDYMLVCEELYTFFETLMIDDQRKYTLTKYATTKGLKTKVISDYNPMFAKFSMKYEKSRQSARDGYYLT